VILVDTSVWIGYLRGDRTERVDALETLLDREVPCALSDLIAMEILQGVRGDADAERLAAYLETQRRVAPSDGWATHLEAARLYRRCRAAGVTVRSTVDCLIARLAVEHDLVLLHDDRDYDRIATVEPRLRLF
jgi:hypothetical protein